MEPIQLPHHHDDTTDVQTLAPILSDPAAFEAAADLMKQLGDPTRIRLFWFLCHKEECVINLAALFRMSSPALSHHLRELRRVGLITGRKAGKEVYYKAAENERCRFLHPLVDKLLAISCPKEIPDLTLSNRELVRHIHDYVIAHLSEHITIETLTRQFAINPTTLKLLFKEEYHASIAAHIKEHRMEKAAELLRQSDLPVGAVSKAVGFQSQSRFAAAFKESYGLLPTEYRKTKDRSPSCYPE